MPWNVAICDESHRIKNRTSQQSRAVSRITATYRFILTGTPIEKNEVDLWAQFKFLKPELLGNWKKFTKRYCRRTGYELRYFKLKEHRKKSFYNKLKPYNFQLLEDEVPRLPEAEFSLIFKLTGRAKKAYKELEHQFYTEYQDIEFLTPIAITNMLRLQQLTGGYLDNGEDVFELEQDKLFTLLDFLEDYPKDKKLVIFARFTLEVNIIKRAMDKIGRSAVIYDGQTKDRSIWREFQYSDRYDTFVSQIATGGLGIELSNADTAIFYSITFSSIDYSQAKARLRSLNKRKNITFIHLLGEYTIDEDTYHSLKMKSHTADSVMQQLRWRKRMAKKSKKEKSEKKSKRTPPPMPKPDWGVNYLAEQLSVEPFTIRQKLRAAGIKKTGRVYDFGNKAKADEAVKQLRKLKDEKPKKSKKDKKDKKDKKSKKEKKNEE